MKFDGYNSRVSVKSKIFRIAFEYDGIQHDLWPNPIHKTKEEFKRQQENDSKKINLAIEHNTIVIKLKAKDGFDFQTIDSFQRYFQILKNK